MDTMGSVIDDIDCPYIHQWLTDHLGTLQIGKAHTKWTWKNEKKREEKKERYKRKKKLA